MKSVPVLASLSRTSFLAAVVLGEPGQACDRKTLKSGLSNSELDGNRVVEPVERGERSVCGITKQCILAMELARDLGVCVK